MDDPFQSDSMKDLTGKEIRGYILRECIGSGGYGAIYRAEQPLVGREVAIKVILPDHAQQPEFRASFEAEARMVGGLVNPNVVPLYDFWESEAGAFLVMPFLRGGNLRQLIDDGPLDLQVAAKIVDQITDALHAAHQKKIVHRDIKPENILLDESGNAYLADFSIAKDLGHKGITKPWEFEGTVAYMAPEQLTGDDITFQTDIYTLGLVIYEMLTGAHPFPELNLMQLTRNPPYEFLPPLQDCGPNLPGELDGVIQQATDKDDSHRYPDVVKLRTAFHRALGIERGEAPAPATLEAQYPSFLEEGETLFIRPFFVGREAELARMEDFLDQAPSGKDQVAFITGGAGTGKTALLNEFTLRAQEADESLIVASGSCSAHIGPGDPYLPFRDILRMLTGEVETQWAAGAISKDHAQRLWHLLPEAIQALMDAGPDLLDVFVTGRGLLSRGRIAQPMGSPALEQLKSWTAFKKEKSEGNEPISLQEQYLSVLLLLANSHPLLLLIDDLQWADAASINMLHHLGRRIAGSPIFILSAYRADEVAFGRDEGRHHLEKALMEFKRRFGDVWIDLDAVDEAEGRRFIQDYLQPEHYQLDDAFKEELYQHTNGHPLFTVELLRAMQERGDLVKGKADRWERGPSLDWDQLPARVEGVIEERLGRLSPGQRDLLDLAAVEGEQFTLQVCARALEKEPYEIRNLLTDRVLSHKGLVLEASTKTVNDQRVQQFRFQHALFRHYLYSKMTPVRQEWLHWDVGRALEWLYEGQTESVAVQLVGHFERAQDDIKVTTYAVQAGDNARRLGASQEAIDFYQRALQRVLRIEKPHRPIERHHIHERLGDVFLVNLSQHDEALQHYEAFLNLAANEEEAARGERKIATIHLLNGDLPQAQEHYKTALSHLHSSPPTAEAGRVHCGLAYLFTYRNQLDQAEQHANQGLELSHQANSVNGIAEGEKVLGMIETFRGNPEGASEHFQQSLDLYRQLGDLPRTAQAHNNLGNAYRMLGQLEPALDHLQEGLDLAIRIGDARERVLLLITTAEIYLDRGEFESAIQHLEQALSLVDEIGVAARQIEVHWILGSAYINYGKVKEAKSHLKMAKTLSRQTEHIQNLAEIYLDLSRISSSEGDLDEAQRYLEAATKAAGTEPSDHFQGLWHRCMGRILSRRERWNDAVEEVEKGLQFFERRGLSIEAGKTHLELGKIYAKRGEESDRKRACDQILAALRIFKGSQARGYIAQAEELLNEFECEGFTP
jgi:tetratricopeptide (TPR) repeat protein